VNSEWLCGLAGWPSKDLLSARLKSVRRIAAADGDDSVSAGATLPAGAASAAAADGDGVVAGVVAGVAATVTTVAAAVAVAVAVALPCLPALPAHRLRRPHGLA
jgi:hypothetical protein